MRVEIPTPSGNAVAEIDRPRVPAIAWLVLTHGAGGGVDTADVNAVRAAALKAGIVVVRLTQPYRVAGRSTPSAPPKQDEAWLAAVGALRKRKLLAGLPLITGGRSNGARVACRTAVASGAIAAVALAFPVHPPGKPELSRIDELDDAGVPVLVIQGDRDPFGMPPPKRGRQLYVINGADHSLRRELPAIAAAVTRFVTAQAARVIAAS